MGGGQDLYREELIRSLHKIWGVNRVNPAIPPSDRYVARPPRDSADDLCAIPYGKMSVAFYLELKTGKNGALSFGTPPNSGGWREGQMQWSSKIYSIPVRVPIILAVTWDGLPKHKLVDRRLHLVPYHIANQTCATIAPIQKTINYVLGKSARTALKDSQLYAQRLWAEWECPRIPSGWDIYDTLIKGLESSWEYMLEHEKPL